ncbi:hypothetical protein OG266_40100 [Streptomyces sp. NBC_00554]|uniref:hypothetical protein n=1 Tax=Streptomyces sp. NBC_00554 TaxID=2903661 RepID=UPI00352D2A64|nr:hypothetical protein OG266_40100 [Streptomyces sp. NBC_00554]
MPTTRWDKIERSYDGCGKCLLGVRRLSRMKAATSSPERQREDVLTAAEAVGGHIIGWADDWEVSGATDPMTRPKLGPWLRYERGPYDGLVAAAVKVVPPSSTNFAETGVAGFRVNSVAARAKVAKRTLDSLRRLLAARCTLQLRDDAWRRGELRPGISAHGVCEQFLDLVLRGLRAAHFGDAGHA